MQISVSLRQTWCTEIVIGQPSTNFSFSQRESLFQHTYRERGEETHIHTHTPLDPSPQIPPTTFSSHLPISGAPLLFKPTEPTQCFLYENGCRAILLEHSKLLRDRIPEGNWKINGSSPQYPSIVKSSSIWRGLHELSLHVC